MTEKKLPHWNDLPSIDLYKEQVLEYLDHVLVDLEVKPITSAMINNYTKHQWIPAPIKKKYSRKHVAHILVIAVLKEVFELSEIDRAVRYERKAFGLEGAYEHFIDELEKALTLIKDPLRGYLFEDANPDGQELKIMRTAALAFALRKLARQQMFQQPQGDPQ